MRDCTWYEIECSVELTLSVGEEFCNLDCGVLADAWSLVQH
jgi:hypothetical protein